MRLLLDTHTFLWWHSDPHLLSPRVLSLCQESSNKLVLSMASIWEMQIKHQLGKLSLHPSLGQIIEEQKRVNGISILNIKLSHILAIGELPLHHRDPFDRLLIAQAKFEKIGFISRDPEIAKYVDLIW